MWSDALLVLVLLGFAIASAPPSPPGLATLGAALARELGPFRATSPDEIYDETSIFEYIDGAAEVYLAYGMQNCLARRYEHPKGGLVLDVFAMRDAAGAYGAFTYDQDGEALEIGQGALLRPGWLTFWQGRYFVSLTAEGEDEEHRQGTLALARAAAAALGPAAPLPQLLQRLPTAGLLPRSVRYLRHPSILGTHLPLSLGDPLGLARDAEAVLGRYEGGALLLVVRYPDAARATAALEKAQQLLASPAPGGREGLWGAAVAGQLLALVGQAPNPEQVRALLTAALAESPPQEAHP